MKKRFSDITGADLLKADVCSQVIHVASEEGTQAKKLISEEQFWGDPEHPDKLMFDYFCDENQGWTIEKDGWNDYNEDKTFHMDPVQTQNWIKDNIFLKDNSTLTIIQGYAGCGKTVFINSLSREFSSSGISPCFNVYVDYDNNASEGGYLTSAMRNWLCGQLINLASDRNGIEIYKKFFNLAIAYSERSASFSNMVNLFRLDGQIFNQFSDLHEKSLSHQPLEEIKANFRTQFICGTFVLSGAVKECFSSGNECNPEYLLRIKKETLHTLLDYYLAIMLLLVYATNAIRNVPHSIILFDNLDIIDNPQHVASFIDQIHLVLNRVVGRFVENPEINPLFHVIIAVRKVTYVQMAPFHEVTMIERGELWVPAKFLDISNLYSTIKVIKYKARIIRQNLNSIIPERHTADGVETFLNKLIQIPDDALEGIGLSGLFNHNIRACTNILERAIEHYTTIPSREMIGEHNSKTLCSALWIHNICAVLQKNGIWKSMGFNDDDRENYHFPTTLSRLIMSYLFNQRRNYRRRIANYDTTEVSFQDIIRVFERFPFVTGRSNALVKLGQSAENDYSVESSRERIIVAIENMLKRNTNRSRVSPSSEIELWRRPIYFTSNAFPLVNADGSDNIHQALSGQIAQFNHPNAKITRFCLTDEGYEFIDKIATHFEFYSVRYNGNRAVPLCNVKNPREFHETVKSVYLQVKKCVDNQRWLIRFYISRYAGRDIDLGSDILNINSSNFGKGSAEFKEGLNQYLREKFHPRTEHDRPQMHIIRTIYDHIRYLNDIRDSLIMSNDPSLSVLNIHILRWIGEYLELYRANLYDMLDDTVGSLNDVFLDLKYMYRIIYTSSDTNHLPKDRNEKHVSVCRAGCHRPEDPESDINIELKNDPMLEKYRSTLQEYKM